MILQRYSMEEILERPRWTPDDVLNELTTLASSAQTIVEIGTWLGRSAQALLRDNCATLYCVDSFTGDGGTGFVKDRLALYTRFLQNMTDAGLRDRVVPMPHTSFAASQWFAFQPIDLIFFDADHSENALYADLIYWMPLLTETGVACGDDYYMPSVRRAVERYFGGKRLIESAARDERLWIARPKETE